MGSTSSVQDTCDWLVTWIQRHLPQTPMTGLSRGFNVICGHLVSSGFLHFIVFALSSSRLTVVGVCYFNFQAHCRKVFAVSSSGPTVVRCLLFHLPGSLSSGVCCFIFRDHCRQVFAVSSSGLTVVRCSPFHLPGSLSFMLLFHLYNTLIKALPEMSFISHVFVWCLHCMRVCV